jgi:hypothetical protein
VDTADLYQGPLGDFVARRTALVHELRRADPEAAEAIGKLRKPAVSVWAIDQLAVGNASVLSALLAAGADARDAQRSVAAGTESRDGFALATGRLRDAVEAAARAAMDTLIQAGHPPGGETDRKIRTTLQAAATGGAADRHALWTGTLDHDLDVAGFGDASESEEDVLELAAVLAPLRRQTASASPGRAEAQRPSSRELVAQRAAERDVTKKDEAAEAARAFAVAARHQADRLAEEAGVAAEKAVVAEQAADDAEAAAHAAHAKLTR